MHYAIENKYLKGIYTSKERANMVNGLLRESAKYIRQDDYVLAYDCIPMFHYITATKPYMRNPSPYLYAADVFKKELDRAQHENGRLPVVVTEKIKTIGSGSNWPDSSSMHDAEWESRNQERNIYLNDFLNKNHYQEIWANEIFRILIPKDSTSRKEL
jgi:hypothetical protein